MSRPASARRPASACDLRSYAWHLLSHGMDWTQALDALRTLSLLDQAEAGDERARRRLAGVLARLAVEERDGRRWMVGW